MKSNSELRSLANLAKQRMRQGNYKTLATTVNPNSTKSRASSYFICNARALRKVAKKAEIITLNKDDSEFEAKVIDMLNCQDILFNPIGQLVDTKLFASMTQTQKELYVLTLADKFNTIKEKYYMDNTNMCNIA